MPSKYPQYIPLALFSLIYFLIAKSTFGFDFVWDDNMFLRETDLYTSPETWLNSAFSSFFVSPNYFRPIPLASFYLDTKVFQLFSSIDYRSPAAHHTMHTLYYWAALLALYTSIDQTLKNFIKANPHIDLQLLEKHKLKLHLLGALLLTIYFIHPANIEALTWLSTRFEVLFLFFASLTLFFSQLENKWVSNLGTFLAFLLAALSKEMAITLPIVIAYINWYRVYRFNELSFPQSLKVSIHKNLATYMALIIGGLCYLTIRYYFLSYILVDSGSSLNYGSLLQKAVTIANSLTQYLYIFFFPFTSIQPLYDHRFPLSITPINITNLVVVTIAFATIIFYLLKKKSDFAFIFILFILLIFPVMHFIPMPSTSGLAQTRFILIPSSALVLLLLLSAQRIRINADLSKLFKTSLIAFSVLWLSGIALNGYTNIFLWQNNKTYWAWAYQKHPNSSVNVVNYASALIPEEEYELALEVIEKSFRSKSSHNINLYAIYAVTLTKLNRIDEAIDVHESIIKLTEDSLDNYLVVDAGDNHRKKYGAKILSNSYLKLAKIYIRNPKSTKEDIQSALSMVDKAIALEPWGYEYIPVSIEAYLRLGDHDKALSFMEQWLEMTTHHQHDNIKSYFEKKKTKYAEMKFDKPQNNDSNK